MGTKMTHVARTELTHVVRRRYCVATGAEKRKILDEFIAATGYHEKSAIRVLNAEPTAKGRQRGDPPVTPLMRQPVTKLREAIRGSGCS